MPYAKSGTAKIPILSLTQRSFFVINVDISLTPQLVMFYNIVKHDVLNRVYLSSVSYVSINITSRSHLDPNLV